MQPRDFPDDREFPEGKVDLSRHEAREVMRQAEFRSNVETIKWGGKDVHVEMLYEGQWLFLGRCDLRGEVYSAYTATTDKAFNDDPIGWYRDRVLYGARVFKKATVKMPLTGFFIVDKTSDG